jgi:hypothetical protein
MERKRQRKIALAVLAIGAVAVAAYRIRSTQSVTAPTQASAVTSQSAGGPAQQASGGKAGGFVNLDALQAARPEPIDGERNPFRFKPKPPPPVPVAQSQASAAVAPVGPPPPPPIALRFISRWESSRTGPIAVLSDGKGLVVQGREGETIEGRYRILRIGVESVELAYLDGRGRQTIRLGQ